MNFEPQKFFIGLVDFFSILMPGAVLAYFLKDWAVETIPGLRHSFHDPPNGAETYLVFLFASYLLGHLTFLLGSVLDDVVYDPLRGWTTWGQIKNRLAKGEDLNPRWRREIAASSLLFGRGADNAVIQAQRIKARALAGLVPENAINAFQWCKARLTKEFPEGLLAVQRFEADSKFFRSFVVVLLILTLFYGFQLKRLPALVCFITMLPALWRYIDQRYKSTEQAYRFIITLEAMKGGPPAVVRRDDGLTYAGAVVYRYNKDSEVEVLLVEATKKRSEYVLPKGHIEPGEDPKVTAVREVREETGNWARIVCWLEDTRLGDNPNAPFVRWYLMEHCESSAWPAENRQHVWLAPTEAERKATYPETRELLAKAKGLIPSKKPEVR